MGDWKDSLFKPSFRGVPFKVTSDDIGVGRRRVEHVYPGKDETGSEDLGKKPRVYRLTGYVIGDDFAAQRDALVDALEKGGPGTLVHPYLGEMQVEVVEASIRHSTREGRVASLEMTFAPAGATVRPRAVVDTVKDVAITADTADIAVQMAFKEGLKTDGQPGWIADDVRAVVGEISNALDAAARSAGLPAEKLSEWSGNALGLKADTDALIRKPGDLVARLSSQFLGLIPGDPRSTWLAAGRLSSFNTSQAAVPLTTPTRLTQASNRGALVEITQRLGLIAEARAVSAVQFESAQETEAASRAMAEALDQAMMTAPDDVFVALGDLRTAVVRDLNIRAAQRPKLITVQPATTQPALLLAHTLFGDDPTMVVAKADDICRRNGVKHPLFVPGGENLEVLSNA